LARRGRLQGSGGLRHARRLGQGSGRRPRRRRPVGDRGGTRERDGRALPRGRLGTRGRRRRAAPGGGPGLGHLRDPPETAAGVVHPAGGPERQPREHPARAHSRARGAPAGVAGGHRPGELMTSRNLTPDRYREVTLAEVDVPLTEEALAGWFVGRDAYRRTRYIIVSRGPEIAVVRVTKASEDPLFSPITSVEVLAGPDECRLVDAPQVDTAVPTQLADVARTSAAGVRGVVVRGRYGHVSFLLDPDPLRVRVVETVPPEPPKLVHQVQRLLDVADDLPPVEIEPELVDLHELAATRPSGHYLLPCRSGRAAPPG